MLGDKINRVATNLENIGNLKNFQNFKGKLREISIFEEKPAKLRENIKICGINANKNLSQQIFSLELLREKFENTLEISEKTEGILSKCGSLSKMATLNQDGPLPVPLTGENPVSLGFSCAVSKQFDAGR